MFINKSHIYQVINHTNYASHLATYFVIEVKSLAFEFEVINLIKYS